MEINKIKQNSSSHLDFCGLWGLELALDLRKPELKVLYLDDHAIGGLSGFNDVEVFAKFVNVWFAFEGDDFL